MPAQAVYDECLIYRGFDRTDVPRRHPAVMIASRRSYWHVGGCDEDLVGHYGATDPMFFHKFANGTGPECRLKIPWGAPALERAKGAEGARPQKDRDFNKRVQAEKVNGTRPWAVDVLRFSWRVAFTTDESPEEQYQRVKRGRAVARVGGVPG